MLGTHVIWNLISIRSTQICHFPFWIKKDIFFDHYIRLLHLVDDALRVNTLGGFKEDFGKYLVGQSIASLIIVKRNL